MSTDRTNDHLVYEELCPPAKMHADCEQAGQNLGLSETRPVMDAPSLRFEDHPQDLPKPGIEISEAAARLASALHLHLD